MSAGASSLEEKPRFLTDVNFNARIVMGLRRIIPANLRGKYVVCSGW